MCAMSRKVLVIRDETHCAISSRSHKSKNSPRKRAVFAFGEGKEYPRLQPTDIFAHQCQHKICKICTFAFSAICKNVCSRFVLCVGTPDEYICRNPCLNRKSRIYRPSCFCLYSPGVMPANFLNARVKWLCEEKPRYEEIAERDLSVYRRRRFASSVFSFCI